MYLGIDLGEKTTGLAISEGQLAGPFKTITHKNTLEAAAKIIQIVNQEKVDKVVIGFVEGKIKSLFLNFARQLKELNPNIVIIMQDETLTSLQARQLQIKLSVPKNKRKEKEHEVAAAIILQSYLDTLGLSS